MYIPLDNLYFWVSNVIDDILIYRFYPHGSRNLSDLEFDGSDKSHWSWRDFMESVPVVAHDQEPLDFDSHQLDWKQCRDLHRYTWSYTDFYRLQENNQKFWEIKAKRGLGATVKPNLNDLTILLHSEKNSPQLEKYRSQGFVDAYWWSHGIIARDWYRFAQHDPRLTYGNEYQFDFNVYARAWSGTREYRLKFLDLLLSKNLVPQSRITFWYTDEGTHYKTHQFRNRDFRLINDLSEIPSHKSTSCKSAEYDIAHYNSCAIDVVLETLYDDERWHLTEKILRPIACGKPFMLAGPAGSLQYLRSYGFKTFDGIIDEHYDTISNPLARLESITDAMRKISDKSPEEKQQTWAAMRDICEFNRAHFFSQAFADQVVGELRENLLQCRQLIQSKHQLGRNWLLERSTIDRELLNSLIKTDKLSRREVAEVIRQCRRRQRGGQ